MFKAGDTVYRATTRLDGVEVTEAKVVKAGPERVTLDRDRAAWRYRRRIRSSECHPTREAALRDLLDATRRSERDYREGMEAEQERIRVLEEMLRTPAEHPSP